ncbi:MAG: aminotransferase class I/II-fold pyridoxal phosphate-dependent enzyme [Thermodesulfobacteriota bacterium]|nr:aminotransferase class I/II-fold pyridoxal phosphate-dependent enzyme [Thermodesulfobacteriota bacterium]
MTDIEFGIMVAKEAKRLEDEGRDSNQIAKILCDADPKASNYGIGIILDKKGGAFPTSPTLLHFVEKELKRSGDGNYLNSMKLTAEIKHSVLQWQRIPQAHWNEFVFCMPSDAGTGCVKTGLEYASLINPKLERIGIEELGWPAYKAIAKSIRLGIKEYKTAEVINEDNVLPLYQCGPMNTTGAIMTKERINERAKAASDSGKILLLDRAYSGFEYARDTSSKSYDSVMKNSYNHNLKPFIDSNTSFILAISPTKSFGSFALRPAGFLLLYIPEPKQRPKAQQILNTLIRARGSSFEHPSTRGLARAMVESLNKLEDEHLKILQRMADAEGRWLRFAKETSIEKLFSNDFAGLFRNPRVLENAAEGLYGAHLYPVLSGNRCRINITGIPSDDYKIKMHVETFAKYIA